MTTFAWSILVSKEYFSRVTLCVSIDDVAD